MSVVMLEGKIFSRLTSCLGIYGNFMMVINLVLVNFSPAVEKMAAAFAMPAGFLHKVLMIMYTVILFKMSKTTAIDAATGWLHLYLLKPFVF
jgi:hypothetical protein